VASLLDRIGAEVDRRRDEALGYLRSLIAAVGEGEAAVQRRVVDEARALGCTVEVVRYRAADVPMNGEFAAAGAIVGGERESVAARFDGAGGGRSVIFFAHPDGEPVAGTSEWRHDPFAGAIEDGRLYGWGVADDLAGVATMIQALAVVRSSGLTPKGDLILASTPSKRHARGVSALLHAGLAADAAVYCHPAESGAGMREIKAFASGQVEFRIIVEGRPPDTTEPLQTAFAHLAVNPIDKAFAIHEALQALDRRRAARIRHALLDATVKRSSNLMPSHLAAGDPGRLSRVPTTCVLGGALSFPPPETLEEVRAEVEAAVREAGAGDPWLEEHPPLIEWVSGVTGAEVPRSHPLYRVVANAVVAVTGEQPVVNPMHTASDIRNPMVQKGIPTVGLGPLCGDLTQNGGSDEWVDIEDYLRAIKVAAGIVVGWCGAVESGT
jgi:acetylornithine deacetylase